jgi:hypothetical protein
MGGTFPRTPGFAWDDQKARSSKMPLLLWLLGVPLSVVILLLLIGVV